MIERMRLRNFRRYQDETVEFKSGINFIEGTNNAGKTSLFYAIEYAFFGRVAGFRSPADLMAADSRDFGVELVMRGADGSRYRLQRMHQKPPRAKSQINGHFTLKQLHASGGEETETYLLSSDFQDHEEALALKLYELLGVSRRIFEIAVATRQGQIPQILGGVPKLDMVVGVTAAVQSEKELRAMALEYEKECSNLPVLTESIRHQQRERTESAARQARHGAELADAQVRRDRLVRDEQNWQPVASRLKGLQDCVRQLERELRQHEELRQARAFAARRLDEHIAEHGDQASLEKALREAAPPSQEALETQEARLRDLAVERRAVDGSRGDLNGRLARRRQLAKGADAVCETCGQPVDAERNAREIANWEAALQAQDKQLAALAAEEHSLRESIGALRLKMDSVLRERSRLEALLETRERLTREAQPPSETLDSGKVADCLRDATRAQGEFLASLPQSLQIGPLPELTADNCDLYKEALQQVATQLHVERARIDADLLHTGQLLERLHREDAEMATRIAGIDRELARLESAADELRKRQRYAEELRQASAIMQSLQTRLRERAVATLAEATLELHRRLSYETAEFSALEIDPNDYKVFVTPHDLDRSVPAHVFQGGGHQLLLGLAFKLAIARSLGRCAFMLLDEPTDGLDRAHLAVLIGKLAEVGGLEQLLVITHRDEHPEQGHRIRVHRASNHSHTEVLHA